MKKLWLVIALCVAIVSVITLSPHAAPESGWSDTLRGVFDSNVSAAIIAEPVDLSGTIKTSDDTDICAMVLASGQFMFSCNPTGFFSLSSLPREQAGTVKRQIYADGFFPKIDILTESSTDAVVMNRSGTCPSYNDLYYPAFVPNSAGKRINISGKVLLQNSQTPICAMVLANGQHMFSCDGSGSYALNIPLDTNGQFKLQVYADGFAPTIQSFDEFSPANDVRMARDVECQSNDSDQVSILVSPQTVLFTEYGQTIQLTATVYDKDGQEVDPKLKWSSSNPQAVSVDEDGIITSSVGVGSATITASFDTSVSNSVTVLVADPAEGAVLVADDQVVGEVTPVDPDTPLGVGVRVNVRLSGITPPAPGTVVLGTGEQPVGGKVVSAVQDGDDVALVLEAIPLDEMFDELVIEQEVDLSREVPTIAKVFADNYDVQWTPGGALEFTLRKTAQSSALTSRALMSSTGVPMGTQVLNPNANHGPFTCEAGFVTPFVLDGFPVSLSVTPLLIWNLNYDSNQGGLQSLLVAGSITGTYKVANTFTAALGGKVSCTTKLGEIPIPLAASGVLSSLALYIPLGVGFDVDGKLTLLQVGFELTTEAKANVFVGVQCPGGSNCGMVTNLDTDVKDEFKWITPDVSTTPLQILSQFRLEPALSGYLSSGLDLGFIPQLFIPARASLLKAQAGVKLAGNFALVEGQMADEDYSSNYLLSQDSVIGAGVEFHALGGLFQANLLSTTISYTDPLAESPKVLEAVSDVKDFVTGDSVTFTVSLDPQPQHINFPVVGYNVAKVSIYRRTEDPSGGVGPADLLAAVVPANGVTDVQMTWTADADDTIDGDYFAFVETKALPFPYFGELETATITTGGYGCIYGKNSDTWYTKSCDHEITRERIILDHHFEWGFWVDDVSMRYIENLDDPDAAVLHTHWVNYSNFPVDGFDCVETGTGWTVYGTDTYPPTGGSVIKKFKELGETRFPGFLFQTGLDNIICWPDYETQPSLSCGAYACPPIDSIIPLTPFPGDCHAWWDHFDEQGIWHECTY